jgi:hypothetical protein
VAPAVLPSELIAPHLLGVLPVLAPVVWVALVKGDHTVIVPSPLSLMTVGPVYRHPGSGTSVRSLRVSDFIEALVSGIVMALTRVGLPALKVAFEQLDPVP